MPIAVGPRLRAATVIDETVVRKREQERAEFRARLVARAIHDHAAPHFLEQIVGDFAVARLAHEIAIQTRLDGVNTASRRRASRRGRRRASVARLRRHSRPRLYACALARAKRAAVSGVVRPSIVMVAAFTAASPRSLDRWVCPACASSSRGGAKCGSVRRRLHAGGDRRPAAWGLPAHPAGCASAPCATTIPKTNSNLGPMFAPGCGIIRL